MVNIKDYLDNEGILAIDWDNLRKLILEEDREKIEEVERVVERFPDFYDFKKHQEFYNVNCSVKINGVPFIIPATGIFRDEIEQTTPIILEHIKNDNLVIDIGCGFGHKTKFYGLNIEGKVIGLDINKSSLDIANKQKIDNMYYIRGNIFKLPFRDNLFDSVLFCNAIQEDGEFSISYLNEGSYYDYKYEKIQELSRIIKPNGKLIIGHNGYDYYSEEVIKSMKESGIKILKDYNLNHKRGGDEIENHITVGVKE